MKKVFLVIGSLLVWDLAMAQSTALDANSVQLANALIQPEIRKCIDSAVAANNVTNVERLDIDGVDTYTTHGSSVPGSVVQYILPTSAIARAADGSLKRITIVFDIEVSSGTGILGYKCSSYVR